jgi:hypothetical protein
LPYQGCYLKLLLLSEDQVGAKIVLRIDLGVTTGENDLGVGLLRATTLDKSPDIPFCPLR